MADFAKAQLLKYGWTEGKGLGKTENGITEALKPILKFDTTGVGHKDTDWKEWWETAFNKAANSIKVEPQVNAVSISVLKTENDEEFKEIKKEASSKKTYGNFLKTSVLYGDNLVNVNNSIKTEVTDFEKDVTPNILTDEELFKACGGRTAHKGARHGLTLSGKLQRIEEQEKNMLKRLEKDDKESLEDKCELDSNANSILPISLLSTEAASTPKISKSRRKKNKRRINDLTHQLNTLCTMNDNEDESICNTSSKKKKRLKRRRSKERKENECLDNAEDVTNVIVKEEIYNIPLPTSEIKCKKTKRKKVKKELDEITDVSCQDQITDHKEEEFDYTFVHGSKKKKSKRERSLSCHNMDDHANQEDNETMYTSHSIVKKSKKSHKRNKNVEFLINKEGSIMSEFKLEVSTCDETPSESNEINESGFHSEECTTSEILRKISKKQADRLNAKIKKKKDGKHRKRHKDNLYKIIKGLNDVQFEVDSAK